MECNKCAVERFIEDIHSSVFKLKHSAWYSIYKSSFIDPEDDRNFEPHSKQFSSSVLFQKNSRMVQEHSTGGDFASIRRTNGGVNTHTDFSRKISAVAVKFPDMLIKKRKGSPLRVLSNRVRSRLRTDRKACRTKRSWVEIDPKIYIT